MKSVPILPLLLLLTTVLQAQPGPTADTSEHTNLVYNGSFEEYRMCPKRIDAVGVLSIVDCWYQPTKGSADYYNVCGSKECGVPVNKLGRQEPRDGDGYCGIYCSRNDYREYLQTRLRRTLRAGDSIRLTFYASLSEESTGAVSTLAALFTHDRISDTVRTLFLHKEQRQVADGITLVEVYNAAGVCVFSRRCNDDCRTVDIRPLSAGLYTVRVTTNLGTKTEKVIVR